MSLVRPRPVWMTNHLPSVLWHRWLGHQTCKNHRPYNLYCVGADVKPCSINQSITDWPWHLMSTVRLALCQLFFCHCLVCCRVDQRKQLSISKKLASLCAADVSLKEFAQRVINDFEYVLNMFWCCTLFSMFLWSQMKLCLWFSGLQI